MKQKLKDLILEREEEMMKCGFSQNRTKLYRRCWKKFNTYLKEKNIDYYDTVLYDEFLENVYDYKVGTIPTPKQNIALKAKIVLEDFEKYKTMEKRYLKSEPIILNNNFECLLTDYLKECGYDYNSESTMSKKKKIVIEFLKYLQDNNIENIEDISKDVIINYINNTSKEFHIRRNTFWGLKNFLKYLYNNNLINNDYSIYIPKIKYVSNKSIPTYFNDEEIQKILNYFKEKSTTAIGKRNYAMFLMLIRYGLRISDVRNIQFDNIKWDENKIIITQQKTKKDLTLPLLADVGNAIIDYIKNGRPNSQERYIFLRTTPPYTKLSINTKLDSFLKKALETSNIKTQNKKGVHSLRHSLATRMLKNETPLNIISSTLGHSNTEITKVYLKVDYDQLKECFVRLDDEKRI